MSQPNKRINLRAAWHEADELTTNFLLEGWYPLVQAKRDLVELIHACGTETKSHRPDLTYDQLENILAGHWGLTGEFQNLETHGTKA